VSKHSGTQLGADHSTSAQNASMILQQQYVRQIRTKSALSAPADAPSEGCAPSRRRPRRRVSRT